MANWTTFFKKNLSFLEYDAERALPVNTTSVPVTFSNQTGSGRTQILQKGQLNKVKIRPQILNEHVESSRALQDTVTSTQIVGQIFKASQSNINGISLTLESAGGTVLDNFESYANSAALQVVWVKGGTNPATLETTIVKTGTKSMHLQLSVALDDWVDTIAAIDYTGFSFNFDYYQTNTFAQTEVSFFIGDGTNTKSAKLTISDVNSWERFNIDESAMTEDGGITNTAAITKIGFRVDKKRAGASSYVDTLFISPPPGNVTLRLWDMGTTIPVSGATTIDSGTQYIELGDRGINSGAVVSEVNLNLSGGIRSYQLNTFAAGTAPEIDGNTLLNVNHYYLITINYVDTDVNVYGTDSTSSDAPYYKNGYAFTAPNEATAITTIGVNNDIQFDVFSTQDVYIVEYLQVIVSDTGAAATLGIDSQISSHIEDETMKVTDVITTQVPASNNIRLEFREKPMFMSNGSKFEIYLNDDVTDDALVIGVAIGYYCVPPIVNG